MKRSVQASRDRSNPVVRFATPDELRQNVNLGIPKDGLGHNELLKLCEKVFDYNVFTGETIAVSLNMQLFKVFNMICESEPCYACLIMYIPLSIKISMLLFLPKMTSYTIVMLFF